VCFLFVDPQGEVGPGISTSVVLCSFVLSVYIIVLVLVFCLCHFKILTNVKIADYKCAFLSICLV
jgi:hypothetical protein